MRVLAAALVLALGGCGTITDVAERSPRIYGGVRQDVEWFNSPCTAGLGCLDMPFSAILDTALLPLTAVCALTR